MKQILSAACSRLQRYHVTHQILTSFLFQTPRSLHDSMSRWLLEIFNVFHTKQQFCKDKGLKRRECSRTKQHLLNGRATRWKKRGCEGGCSFLLWLLVTSFVNLQASGNFLKCRCSTLNVSSRRTIRPSFSPQNLRQGSDNVLLGKV